MNGGIDIGSRGAWELLGVFTILVFQDNNIFDNEEVVYPFTIADVGSTQFSQRSWVRKAADFVA